MKLVLTNEQIQLLNSLGDKHFNRLYNGSEEIVLKGIFIKNTEIPNVFEYKINLDFEDIRKKYSSNELIIRLLNIIEAQEGRNIPLINKLRPYADLYNFLTFEIENKVQNKKFNKNENNTNINSNS